jgi:tellurite resistance protein TerC
MDWSIPIIVIQLIFLEGILSIDNAAVLGALVVGLPDDIAIVWPQALKKVGDSLHPVLGNQRTAALRVGLLGAYVGRGLMLFMATLIIQNPWLKLLGAAYLIRLAFDNLGMAEEGETDAHVRSSIGKTFWPIVLTVELTDLAFSMDNVVAAVALSSRFWVVMLGVAIGIIFMRFAAGLFSYAIEKHPVLKYTAYILVFNIGVELLLEEFHLVHFGDFTRFGISLATILLSLAYERYRFLHVFQPALVWIGQGFSNFNEVIDWALLPMVGLVKLAWRLVKCVFSQPCRPGQVKPPLPPGTQKEGITFPESE